MKKYTINEYALTGPHKGETVYFVQDSVVKSVRISDSVKDTFNSNRIKCQFILGNTDEYVKFCDSLYRSTFSLDNINDRINVINKLYALCSDEEYAEIFSKLDELFPSGKEILASLDRKEDNDAAYTFDCKDGYYLNFFPISFE